MNTGTDIEVKNQSQTSHHTIPALDLECLKSKDYYCVNCSRHRHPNFYSRYPSPSLNLNIGENHHNFKRYLQLTIFKTQNRLTTTCRTQGDSRLQLLSHHKEGQPFHSVSIYTEHNFQPKKACPNKFCLRIKRIFLAINMRTCRTVNLSLEEAQYFMCRVHRETSMYKFALRIYIHDLYI